MLCIQNIRFWCKVQGLFDRINTPETVLRIVLDDTFALPHLPGTTKQNTTDWQEHIIPPIELSPYQTKYKIEFALYREGLLIGMGKTEFGYIQSRKDCLDIVDEDFRISGKLVYELNWAKSVKNGNYITYDQFVNTKTKAAKEGGKEAIVTQKIKTQREKKVYVRPEGEEQDCSSGICACFAVRKKKKTEPPPQIKEPKPSQRQTPRAEISIGTTPQVRQMETSGKVQPNGKVSISKFTNNPYVYFQEDLQGGKVNDIQQLNRLSYYSKAIITSK